MERRNDDFALDPEEIGARVRAARAYANLNRRELSDASGLPPGVIKRLEAGIRLGTSTEELRAIAIACGVPEIFMVTGFAGTENLAEDARRVVRMLINADVGAPALRMALAYLELRDQDADGQTMFAARS